MDGRMLGVLCLLIILVYTPYKTKATGTKITRGLTAGKNLAQALKDGNFPKSLTNIGSNVAPFLSVLGPLATLALQFIPTKDSPELAYMKQQFQAVNNKLDIVISEFKEVKNAIDWSAIKVSYGTYERKIRAAKVNLNRAYSLQGELFKVEKDNFVENYKQSFGNSLQHLYDGIVNDDHVFSKNILEAAIKQTKNHKRKVEKFALGLIQLLVEGIEVKVSYYALKKMPHDHLIKEWDRKMRRLKRKLVEVTNRIKKAYETQVEEDTKTLINEYHAYGNRALMTKIYNFVDDKFDWRYWFVAVYDDVRGYDKHTTSSCGDTNFLHTKGKNIIVASQDKIYSSHFSKKNAEKNLAGVESAIDGCSEETRDPGDRARTLVREMGKSTGNSCVPYALEMAVQTGRGLWFISFDSHRAYRKIAKRKSCVWDCPICSRWSRRCTKARCSYKQVYWYYNMILFG